MATLKTLAKRLDFQTETEYFDYMINSHYNGNFDQCRKLFADMSKADKKEFITYMQDCWDYPTDKTVFRFYFDLL
jgi:hypothetical protein